MMMMMAAISQLVGFSLGPSEARPLRNERGRRKVGPFNLARKLIARVYGTNRCFERKLTAIIVCHYH